MFIYCIETYHYGDFQVYGNHTEMYSTYKEALCKYNKEISKEDYTFPDSQTIVLYMYDMTTHENIPLEEHTIEGYDVHNDEDEYYEDYDDFDIDAYEEHVFSAEELWNMYYPTDYDPYEFTTEEEEGYTEFCDHTIKLYETEKAADEWLKIYWSNRPHFLTMAGCLKHMQSGTSKLEIKHIQSLVNIMINNYSREAFIAFRNYYCR